MQNHGEILIDAPACKDAWPSSYYGRTRRIDLEKFYHDVLKASNDESSNNSSSDEDELSVTNRSFRTSSSGNTTITKKVTFCTKPPVVFEYEPEYEQEDITKTHELFDDGWPGRTKTAMNSTGFIDFKSKIEAKLGAINDPSLISQLDTLCNKEPVYCGYRNRKSPLVQKLNLRPIPNEKPQPNLMDDTPSPSSSYTDSPLTPGDGHAIEPSILSPGGSKWLNRTLSRIRNNSPSRTK